MIQKIKDRFLIYINDDKFKEILFGSLYTTLAKVIAMVIGIVTSIIGARYYGPDMVGFSMIISSILGIGAILSISGLTTAMLQIIPEYIAKSSASIGWNIYSKILNLMLVASLVVSVIYYFLADIIANHIFHNAELAFFLSLSSLVLVFRAVYDLNSAKIRLLGNLKLYALFQILPKVFTFILLLVLTFFFFNKYNLVYIVLAIPVIMTIISFVYLVKYKSSKSLHTEEAMIDLPRSKTIFSLAFPMLVTSGMFLLIAQTDIIMLGMYRPMDEVGIYSIVLGLLLLITFVINSIEVISGPKFSKLFAENNIDELKYVARKSSQLSFFVSFPLIMLLFMFGKWILSIYGEEFIYGYTALLILLFGQFISSVVGPVGYFLDMTGHEKAFRNIVLMAGGLNIIANYILIPMYGLVGAAIASLLSVMVWKIGASLYIKKIFGFYILYTPFIGKNKNKL